MWHDMDPAQEKILGVVGVILLGYLLLTLIISTGIAENFSEGISTVAMILLFTIIAVGLASYLIRMHSLVKNEK